MQVLKCIYDYHYKENSTQRAYQRVLLTCDGIHDFIYN